MFAIPPIGPIEKEDPARRQNNRSIAHQANGRWPRRNVDHVDADHEIGPDRWVDALCDIKLNGRPNVRQVQMESPGISTCASIGIRVAWLKRQFRVRSCEVHGVFTASARDLQHGPKLEQVRAQCHQDRVAIACGGWSVAASIIDHATIVSKAAEAFKKMAEASKDPANKEKEKGPRVPKGIVTSSTNYNLIPDKYSDASQELLTFEVTRGDNTFDIKLTP